MCTKYLLVIGFSHLAGPQGPNVFQENFITGVYKIPGFLRPPTIFEDFPVNPKGNNRKKLQYFLQTACQSSFMSLLNFMHGVEGDRAHGLNFCL